MNLLKLTIRVALCAVFAGGGTVACASSTDYHPVYDTYVFEALPGYSKALDGSTITIEGSVEGHTISSWDLVDVLAGYSDIQLTRANSHLNSENILFYDATTWSGSFSIGSFEPTFVTPDTIIQRQEDTFMGQNSGAGTGSLSDSYVDPPGNWAEVPDALSSLPLFALALAGLGAARLFFRGQTAFPAQN